MFYLGIDQHSKQLTVNLRNEEGSAVIGRQVSTEWLGSISKQGSRIARFLLGQLSTQLLRRDRWMRDWYKSNMRGKQA